MRNEQIYIILYDIEDDKVRDRLAKHLEQWGYERIQYSVFIGLQPIHKNKTLQQIIKDLIDIEAFPNDKVFSISLPRRKLHTCVLIGKMNADTLYLKGEKKWEIF